MLKEKHLKLCYELEPNELKTIKTGGWGVWGVCKLSHIRARMLAQTRAFTRGNSGTCPCLRDEAAEPSNLNTSHSRRLRARREGRAENKPRAIFKNSSGATRVERAAARRGTLGFWFFFGGSKCAAGPLFFLCASRHKARVSRHSMSGRNAGG